MRVNLTFSLSGKSRDEIESKLKERIAKYLGIDPEDVEDHADIEMLIFVGEAGPMELTFTADCKVKVKN